MYNSCSSGYGSGCGYSSGLEGIVYNSGSAGYSGSDYSTTSYLVSDVETPNANPIFDNTEIKPFSQYDQDYKSEEYQRSAKPKYYVGTDAFLKPNRVLTPFVGEVSEIKDLIQDTFMKVTGMQFPDDIEIHLVDDEQMKKIPNMHRGVQGFAVNRKSQGLVSSIFVRKGELAKIMIVLGHEIGHVLTRNNKDKQIEEAKAFAFQMQWMKVIKKFNIGNLGTQIELDKPAVNGIHNVALDFVLSKIKKGKNAYDIYLDLIKGHMRIGG